MDDAFDDLVEWRRPDETIGAENHKTHRGAFGDALDGIVRPGDRDEGERIKSEISQQPRRQVDAQYRAPEIARAADYDPHRDHDILLKAGIGGIGNDFVLEVAVRKERDEDDDAFGDERCPVVAGGEVRLSASFGRRYGPPASRSRSHSKLIAQWLIASKPRAIS